MKPSMITFIYIIFIAVFIVSFSAAVSSEPQRIIPPIPEVEQFKVEFNGDSLKGYYLLLDFRTSEEKKRDTEKKSLAGDVIIYFQGHSQRADDGYSLTSKLSAWSKSGIVLIPICDTPFGIKKEWRGDAGKQVILMGIIEHALAKNGIALKPHNTLTDMKVTINKNDTTPPPPDAIQAGLSLMGWSHGSILARRFAHSYPGIANSLVQMEPAGFADFGGENCTGPACASWNFAIESACVGLGIFSSNRPYILDIGWGGAKGLFGDIGRSCSSCITGNFSILKPFRFYKDGKDCIIYADDNNYPVSDIKSITVIYAINDSFFTYDGHAGIKDPYNVTQKENEQFFEKFYPLAVKSGAKCTINVFPGNHIAPMVYSEKFAETALSNSGQLK